MNYGLLGVVSRMTIFDLLSFCTCLFLRNTGNTEKGKAAVRCYFSFHLFGAYGKQSTSELQCLQNVS